MDIGIIEALGLSLIGVSIVFLVLILLMGIIRCMAAFIVKKQTAAPAAAPAPAAKAEEKPAVPAPGSCGELTAFSVPDRIAAMVMAIVADQLDAPLNELRFISIKEVK